MVRAKSAVRMLRSKSKCFCLIVAVSLAFATFAMDAGAQPDPTPTPGSPTPAPPPPEPALPMILPAPVATTQGVAVLAMNGARDDSFALARSIYATTLRPHTLDELRARILGGDPPPPTATKEIRELGELRAQISGEDVASRRLLSSIAQQLNVQAILVVSHGSSSSSSSPSSSSAPEPPPIATMGTTADASADAGGGGAPATPTAPASTGTASARLFLTDTGDFDAARYQADSTGSWKGTATSLVPRFPPLMGPAAEKKAGPPTIIADGKENKPFYKSPWLWAALGAAVLVGGFFFFASQDNSSDPIHLQLHVPR